MNNVILKVEGMSCQHCENSIEEALKTIGAQGKVDLASGSVSVEYNEDNLKLDKIKEAIEEQGYDVV
jgi:copper chaperone